MVENTENYSDYMFPNSITVKGTNIKTAFEVGRLSVFCKEVHLRKADIVVRKAEYEFFRSHTNQLHTNTKIKIIQKQSTQTDFSAPDFDFFEYMDIEIVSLLSAVEAGQIFQYCNEGILLIEDDIPKRLKIPRKDFSAFIAYKQVTKISCL